MGRVPLRRTHLTASHACLACALAWRPPLQKASGVIGSAAENEAQRSARLYGLLQDFGEMDLVVRRVGGV